MIWEFQSTNRAPHVVNAAERIRKLGNRGSHYEPSHWSDGDIRTLFKEAKLLHDYLLSKFYKKDIIVEAFSTDLIGSADQGNFRTSDEEKIDSLADQVNVNNALSIKISKLKDENRLLKRRFSIYENDLRVKIQELSRIKEKEKQLQEKIENINNTESSLSIKKSEIHRLSSMKKSIINDIRFFEDKLNTLKIEKDKVSLDNKKITDELTDAISEFTSKENKNNLPRLSQEQESLISIDSGRHFLEAPPGSGKTTILTQRLRHALTRHQDDSDIVCLTFTTRAAEEMQNRASSLLGDRKPFIGNFHSFCLQQIRSSRYLSFKEKRFGILDDEYRTVLLDAAIESIELNTPIKLNKYITNLASNINISNKSSGKYNFNKLFFDSYLDISVLTSFEDSKIGDEFYKRCLESITSLVSNTPCLMNNTPTSNADIMDYLLRIFLRFNELKVNSGSWDYDDILCLGLQQIIKNKTKKSYIQIDEVQDLSPIQWEILDAISDESSHVFCVGDSFQSIYGFLGADLEHLRSRTHAFTTHEMKSNFRSDKHIVDVLSAYRQKNWNLPGFSSNSELSDSQSTLLLSFPDDVAEAHDIVHIVDRILQDASRNEVGLLFSTNNATESYCQFLTQKNMKFFRVSQYDLMQRKQIQDWLSVLKAYQGVATNRDWWRLIYRFARSKPVLKNSTKHDCIKLVNKLQVKGFSVKDILQTANLKEECASSKLSNVFQYNVKDLVTKFHGEGVVVYDTETTGLNFLESKIVQIAAVKVINGVVVDVFDRYVSIDIESDDTLRKQFEESQDIHKIKKEQVLKGQSLNEVLADFFSFVGDCAVVAHNLTFDETMLKMNINSESSNFHLLNAYAQFRQNTQLDTLLLTRQHFPKLKSYKLADLLNEFSLKGVNSHNALDDVKATAELLTFLIGVITPKLESLDEIIDSDQALTNALRSTWSEIENLMDSETIKGELSLSDALETWLGYISKKADWYDYSVTMEIIDEATEKLIPWLDKNNYHGLLNDLTNERKASVERLFTLKEADLIDKTKHKLIVSTIHRAKGLEFETVILPQVTNDRFPPWVPDDTSNEERDARYRESQRLLYVALSRPTKKLIVSYHEKKTPKMWQKGLSSYIEVLRDSFMFVR
ncbi:hypothetical protein VCO01S_03430 [Vibrio comitans NBRC 102076]|uniref:DNA 3'-5' helicase n=2 Tax=Vibrio comitans TaxID=413401 RepID=A0A4Y3IK72_9VIBR|nr:hypothetical protein VCO01S_03430 [Vibrio comitans NBRC 102076]